MKILTAVCGAALLLCGAILAQSTDRITVHFTTPVTIGETRFPAGDCDIQVMHSASDNIVLVVRSQEGTNTSVVASHISDPGADLAPGRASVVLDRRGDTYRLNRIMFPDHSGYQLNMIE